jgi:ribosomal protein S18 acetylase RimI-like enzyme
MDEIAVEIVSTSTLELAHSIRSLIGQLTESGDSISEEQLREIIASPATKLFIARINGSIVGMLTLASYRIPTAIRSFIEDVVVDEKCRGRGIAEALTRAALERAHSAGATGVDLTSQASREAANRLYQRLGFQRRDTNVYRFHF